MMAGGMFGFGLIAMLLGFGLLMALFAVLVWAPARNGNPSQPAVAGASAGGSSQKACSHCGAAIHPDWSHCPQCGTPV